jgi:hypothetical protein
MNNYIKEDVEKMLREHKENESKLTEIDLKTEEYQQRLEYAGTVYEDTEKEVIENMQIAGQSYDSIHSNTNKISDKVLNTAINYKKELNYINKEDREYLTSKLEELNKKKMQLNKIVVRVKNMMNPLTQEERFVIETYYMNKAKWDYVEKAYFNEFEKYKSIKQLQTYRDNAIKSMLKIINIGLDSKV